MIPYKLETTGVFFKPQEMTWTYGGRDEAHPATLKGLNITSPKKVHLVWWFHPRQKQEYLMAITYSKFEACMVSAAPEIYQELRKAILHRLFPDEFPDFDLNKALLAIAKLTGQEPEDAPEDYHPRLPEWLVSDIKKGQKK